MDRKPNFRIDFNFSVNICSLELINSSIEAVVDLVTEEYHPLAKVAKDTSAAAVFVSALASVVVGLIIFLPKLIDLIF